MTSSISKLYIKKQNKTKQQPFIALSMPIQLQTEEGEYQADAHLHHEGLRHRQAQRHRKGCLEKT